ncbi:YidH family protein [Alicyclobacillus fastidiosus]|uniref:YidH family protein n=1 Tax=Alicyclobacillus fastidiosus TaxID=392011 RepID=UPI0034D66681
MPSDPSTAPIDEYKFVQQHLANERTFLAWLRTIVSIIGVGFITTTLHFELSDGHHRYADLFTKVIGLDTLILALVVSIFAANSYLRKRRGINTSEFRATGSFVIFFSLSIILVLLQIACYMALAY